MLFQLKKLPEIINLTRFLKSFWILYIDQIIVYNTFYSTLTFYIVKDRCQMHTLKVFRSPVWLLLHKLSSPHYHYICKMRRGDRLPLTQKYVHICEDCNSKFVEMHVDASDIYPSVLVFYTRHRVNITIYQTVYLHTDMCLQTLTHIQLKNKL